MHDYRIRSPKRDASARTGWRGFFPYYAGFSEQFASELIASANLPRDARVWDPWNGSGTTTYAASSLGFEAVGNDLNPVMIIVARARLLPSSEADSLRPIAEELLRTARRSRAVVRQTDPLRQWLDEPGAALVRNLDRAIRKHLVGSLTLSSAGSTNLCRLSGIAAAMYVSLFSVCRAHLSSLRSSNPTWYRSSLSADETINIQWAQISDDFLGMVDAMQEALVEERVLPLTGDAGPVALGLADTAASTLTDRRADLVVTSPPYCTRIDYAASTRIELAVIGPWVGVETQALSRTMIGTTRVPKKMPSPGRSWGPRCISFLRSVRDHPSKASRSYYLKNHADYFDKMARSLANVAEGLKDEGTAVLVVQDSYYKDVLNPLPDILAEMGACHGLYLYGRKDFSASRSMSGINQASRTYREHKKPTESVLFLKKGR